MVRDPDDPDNLSAPPSLADSFERLLAEPADMLAAPLTPGTIVAGRYEVIERIGAGAMGMVYLAMDRDLERKIALKLHKKRAGTEQLRREALAMARLAHPNVVTVFEVGEHEGRTFVAMEYVAGTTLRQWLAAEHRTPNQIIDILISAGEGLIAAHDAKLVHRDFKPENVLIGRDGRARVSDFGLARESGNEIGGAPGGTGAATGIAGTPAYMAPEQALGISVDARADQYAFCGVAWEALVGPWPRTDKATKQPHIRRVLERGLAKDPSARYPTMRALLAALRGAISRGHIVLGAIAVALLVVASAVAFAWPASTTAVSCDTAGIEMLPVALDVAPRLAATELPVVVDTARDRLARFRASYVAAAKAVCVNGLVDHTWSDDLYQRGRTCLDLRLRTFARTFSNTNIGPYDLVERIVRLTDESTCADATVLASRPAMPTDPATLEQLTQALVTYAGALTDYGSSRKETIAKAVSEIEAMSVATEPLVAGRLDVLRGLLLEDEGKRKEAEALYAKGYYGARGIDDPELALTAVANLITLLAHQNEPALDGWLDNALADAKRARSRAPFAAARVYNLAGYVNDAFGDPTKTIPNLDEALAILGDQPSRLKADSYLIRGSSHITNGQPDLAFADYKEGIALIDRLYGPDHPVVAKIKLETSAAMAALNRKDDSLRLAMEAEVIMNRHPSPDSDDLAQMKLNLGAAYANAKDYRTSRKYLTEARAITLTIKGPAHPDLALIDSNIAEVYVSEKDFATAMKLGREALALMERTTPKPHEDRGNLLRVISDAAGGLRDYDTAIAMAVLSADEFAEGDDRKPTALASAAHAANDGNRAARALELVAKARSYPAKADPQVKGRIELEYARALIALGRDRAAATKALEEARTIFQAEAPEWVEEVDAARAKLR